MGEVTVRLYAAAAEAGGTHQLGLQLPHDPAPLQQLITQLQKTVPAAADSATSSSAAASGTSPSLQRVCDQSSFLINGTRAAVDTGQVRAGDVVDVLPPFAGG